jgi:hypothetical protein
VSGTTPARHFEFIFVRAFVTFAGAGNYSTIYLAGDIVVAREDLASVKHFVGAIDSTVDLREREEEEDWGKGR